MKSIYKKDIKAMVKNFNLTEDESEWLNDIAETRNREFAAELKAMKKELEEMEEILHLYL